MGDEEKLPKINGRRGKIAKLETRKTAKNLKVIEQKKVNVMQIRKLWSVKTKREPKVTSEGM